MAAARPAATLLFCSAFFDLDLLLDAFEIVAFVVQILLDGICENLIRLANAFEHVFGVLPTFLVEVPLLVRMPL